MSAGEIYRSLSSESYWATKSRSVRWLAARYYAGVDRLEQLKAACVPSVACTRHGYDVFVGAALTAAEVEEIIRLR